MKYLLNKSIHSVNKKINAANKKINAFSILRMMQQMLSCLVILTILVSSYSCKGKDTYEDSHEGTSILFSAYNSDYELFAEATPFSIKAASEIKVHLTRLDNFKPLDLKSEAESVTLNLIVDNKNIRQTVYAPSSNGIYTFQLQPEISGNGKLILDIQTANGISQIQVPNVNVFDDEHDANHAAMESHPSASNSVVFPKEQSWKIDFATELPVVETFGQVIRTTAQTLSSQSEEMIITARTDGVAVFAGASVTEGKNVRVGEWLFTISGAGWSENDLNIRLIEAKNSYEKAAADYKRAQTLVIDKIVSEKEFLQLKSEYETAKAIYDNLHKNFSNGQQITSPLSGYIKQLFVSNGQYVAAGDPLVMVSNNKTMLLKADVQAKYAALLPMIKTAYIRSIDKKTIYSLEDLNGKILSFGKSVNDDNFLIPVTFRVDNKAGFISGGFVEIFIQSSSGKPVITVPHTALTEEQGLYFVYVQLTPEQFEKREVKTGITNGRRTEIISGLSENERIVSRGAISVKLAQASGTVDTHAGHAH
jgi:RND family efflux transporter MFP subunit